MEVFNFTSNSSSDQQELVSEKTYLIDLKLEQLEKELQQSNGEVTRSVKNLTSSIYKEVKELEIVIGANERAAWDYYEEYIKKSIDELKIKYSILGKIYKRINDESL